MTVASDAFTPADFERARSYHRPRYRALVLDLLLGLGVPALFAFGRLLPSLGGVEWWGRALSFGALTVAATWGARLPLSYWRDYRQEHRWGFSTQSRRDWLVDRAKGLAIALVLTPPVLTVLVWLIRALPSAWPAVAAPGAAAAVFVLAFVAPLVLEPVFNRFEPLRDEQLAAELHELAERAGVPVRAVLEADASRRTRKHNAYVSGLGRTRRVVVWDTLLERDPREVRLVVAHELGHRRYRHVAGFTAMAMAGAAVSILVLWAVLGWNGLLDAADAAGSGDPRVVPLVLLFAGLLELAAAPLASAASRRWERQADRFSLELTGDRDGYEATHRALAAANLADLEPPRALYLLFFTHPTPPERIAAGRAWAASA